MRRGRLGVLLFYSREECCGERRRADEDMAPGEDERGTAPDDGRRGMTRTRGRGGSCSGRRTARRRCGHSGAQRVTVPRGAVVVGQVRHPWRCSAMRRVQARVQGGVRTRGEVGEQGGEVGEAVVAGDHKRAAPPCSVHQIMTQTEFVFWLWWVLWCSDLDGSKANVHDFEFPTFY